MPRIMNLDEIAPFDIHVPGKSLPKDEVRNIIRKRVKQLEDIIGIYDDESLIGLGAQLVIGELHKLMPSAKEKKTNEAV